jgi:hypothetical protein
MTLFICNRYMLTDSNPIMPQMLRFAMSDALSYDPVRKIGGPFANYAFTKFKKAKVNTGLAVCSQLI